MNHNLFIYGDDTPSHGVSLHFTVPRGIGSKRELLTTLANHLHFPDYFGENWDAFEECMRDLSWLAAGRVVLTHNDIPLVYNVANARTYLAILNSAVSKMSKSADHPLSVAFPNEFRQKIDWLLRSQRGQDERRSR